ncbi:hypothetical protein LW967_17580, partial [Erwinia amylovora]|uniref:hypothetical protein n=1 Tax=Erwinia amylovora TaxID=552 RepID=UPI0020BDB7B9
HRHAERSQYRKLHAQAPCIKKEALHCYALYHLSENANYTEEKYNILFKIKGLFLMLFPVGYSCLRLLRSSKHPTVQLLMLD